MRSTDELTSGFVRADFLLSFAVADDAARARLAATCAGEWQGTRVTDTTWELATPLSPDAFETALAALLSAGDRAVYYYLSDTKRLFRVVVEG